jgi:hypothetical protein
MFCGHLWEVGMQLNDKNIWRSAPVKIAGLTLLLIASAVQAANWTEFRGRAVPGTRVYVDDNSVEIDRDIIVKGWVKFEYDTPKMIEGKLVIGRMTQRAVNCENGRYWVTEDWLNVKNGADPIPLAIAGNNQQWQKAAPSSEAEMAQDALCYANKSLFGSTWDTVKEAYESPKADVADVSTEELNNMEVTPDPQDTQFKAWVGNTSLDSATASETATNVIISKDIIRFIVWDKELNLFREDPALPIDQIRSAALVRGGNYEQLKQIQLITNSGKTVISFSAGEDKLAEGVFNTLLQSGVRDFNTTSFVHGNRANKPN